MEEGEGWGEVRKGNGGGIRRRIWDKVEEVRREERGGTESRIGVFNIQKGKAISAKILGGNKIKKKYTQTVKNAIAFHSSSSSNQVTFRTKGQNQKQFPAFSSHFKKVPAIFQPFPAIPVISAISSPFQPFLDIPAISNHFQPFPVMYSLSRHF